MTENEAKWEYCRAIDLIKQIKTEETHERYIDRHKAFKLAIEALEEIQRYQLIGTMDECRAAVERMKPKEAIMHKNPIEGADDLPVCPNCNTIMVRTEIFGRTIDEHCVSCRQALDWGE